MNKDAILKLLAVGGSIFLRSPEFKAVFDMLRLTFDSDVDQATLQRAYELAISDAKDAHRDLQELVAKYGS